MLLETGQGRKRLRLELGGTGQRERHCFACGEDAAGAMGTARMWLIGDLVRKHREGTSHQSGQWFTETTKTRRKAECRDLSILRGLACLCITVLLCQDISSFSKV